MASIGALSYTIGTTTCSIYSTLSGLQTDGVTYRLKVWVSSGDTVYSGNVRYTSTQQVSVSVSGLSPNTYYSVNTRLQYLPTGGSWTDSTVTRSGSFTTKGQTTYSYYLTLYGNGGTWNGSTYISDYDTSTSTSYTFYLSGYTRPTRSGYSFAGWYTASSGGTAVNSITATSSSPSKEVYAHWNRLYTLSYNPNGGTTTPTGGSYIYQQQVTLASAISHNSTSTTYTTSFYGNGGSTPSDKTSSRVTTYAFTKWSFNGTLYNAGSTFTMPSSDVTMTANWATTTTTGSIVLPNSTYSGHTFKGWYTASSGGTRIGGAGDTIYPTSSEMYYAQWEDTSVPNFYWLGSDSADWNATTGIVQGASVTNMTATAWKSIGTKIRALQTLLGDTPSTFTTTMQSGDVFEADFYNEVTDALNDLNTRHSIGVTVPNDTAKGNVLFYYLFNGGASIKQCLNNIIEWYNTR